MDWKSWKCKLIHFDVHERCSAGREKFGKMGSGLRISRSRSRNGVALIGSDSASPSKVSQLKDSTSELSRVRSSSSKSIGDFGNI